MRVFGEAFRPAGTPRRLYAALTAALEGRDLEGLRERMRADARDRGLSFGEGDEMAIDPIPRLVEGGEWDELERGLAQRARALNAFLHDVYGDRRAFSAGVVPAHVLETAS